MGKMLTIFEGKNALDDDTFPIHMRLASEKRGTLLASSCAYHLCAMSFHFFFSHGVFFLNILCRADMSGGGKVPGVSWRRRRLRRGAGIREFICVLPAG